MTPDELIAARRPKWNELNQLVETLVRRGPRRLTGDQPRQFIYLYREASADLARLKAINADPDIVRGVNRLVTRAHGHLYARRERARLSLLGFFGSDFPRLFRRRWRYSAASLGITLFFAVLGYVSVQDNPSMVADILGGAEWEFRGEKSGAEFLDRFERTPSPLLSGMVTTNNIMVALTAYALGITFGIGTFYVLIVNGAMLGGFAGAHAQHGAGGDFWSIVLVHGGLELTAILIAGGAGLIMGHALWCPGRRTRIRALREEARDAARLVLGLIPAFIVAGFLEGFVTPAEGIPQMVKLSLGLAVMLVFWAYLAIAGQSRDSTTEHADLRAGVLR